MAKNYPNIISLLTLKSDTFYVDDSFTIRQFMEKADYHRFSVVPVLDQNGYFVTTVTEGDILRHIKNNASFDLSAAESDCIMNIPHYRPYQAVKVNTDFMDLARMLVAQNFVPVTDDRGVFIGIIKRRTVMEYFFKAMQEESA